MLVIAGAADIVDAIWVFRYDGTLVELVVFEENLAARPCSSGPGLAS
jgi:hypothetical protein